MILYFKFNYEGVCSIHTSGNPFYKVVTILVCFVDDHTFGSFHTIQILYPRSSHLMRRAVCFVFRQYNYDRILLPRYFMPIDKLIPRVRQRESFFHC